MEIPLNPYVAGNPVGDSPAFIGRADVLREVLRILRRPQDNAIVLYGQRRIGKTSILQHLAAQLPHEGPYHPVYFDLQDKTDWSLDRVLRELARTVTHALEQSSPDGSTGLATVLRLDPETGPRREWLSAALGDLPEGSSLVLLFDEFDVLADPQKEQAAAAFFPYLRGLLADAPGRLQLVFVIGRNVDDLDTIALSLFKGTPYQRVSLLSREDTTALVHFSEANDSLIWINGSAERVWQLTCGHPFLTQQLCSHIWERAYDEEPDEPPTVSPTDVDAAVSDALGASRNTLEWLWDGLPPAERVVAAALAEAGPGPITQEQLEQLLRESGVRVVIRELQNAPHLLQEWDLIEPTAGGYRFRVELLRCWIAKHKPLKRVQEELDRIEPAAESLYRAALGLYRSGQLNRAVDPLRQAVSLNPNHVGANQLLADILLAQGQPGEARQLLEQLYEYQPAAARSRLVEALLAQSRAAESDDEQLALYERVLELDPTRQEAAAGRQRIWRQRGDTALESDDRDGALEAYRMAGLAKSIAHVEALQRQRALATVEAQAQAHARERRWADAAAEYERLVAQAPDEKTRAELQDRLKQYRQEAELARLFAEGVEALERKDWKRAQRALFQVVSHRMDYQEDRRRATELLDQAIRGASHIASARILPPILPSVPEYTPAISAENANRVAQLACWGKETVNEVAYSLDGRLLAVASSLGVYLYEAETQAQVRFIKTGVRVSSVAFSPDGATLALGAHDNTVQLWRMDDGALLRTLKGRMGLVLSVAFSPDGATLASGAWSGMLLWRVAYGAVRHTLKGHTASVRSAVFSPRGTTLASGSDDHTVRLWRVSNGALRRTLKGRMRHVTSVAFSPGGTMLASGSGDRAVRLWRVFDGTLLHTFKGHTGAVRSVAFSPDKTTLASGADDKTVRLWRVSDGALLHTLKGHTALVSSVAFSPDGVTLASGSRDGTVRLWGVK